MKFLLLLSVLSCLKHYAFASEGECITPDGGIGICKPFCKCTELVAKLELFDYNETEFVMRDINERRLACHGADKTKYCCGDCIAPNGRSGLIKNNTDCEYYTPLLTERTLKSLWYFKRSRLTRLQLCCSTLAGQRNTRDLECDKAIEQPPTPGSICCGRDTYTEFRIYGGTKTGIKKYPWAVLLEYDSADGLKMTCDGSLITNRHVITAAHCFFHPSHKTPKRVRVGEYDKWNPGRDCELLPGNERICTDGALVVPIDSVKIHPDYLPTWYNPESHGHHDIAVIKLAHPVKYTDFVRPICLPSANYSVPRDNPWFTVTGWGYDNDRPSRLKREVNVKFADYQTCKSKYLPERIWAGTICAGGERGRGACIGDSGGPLMALSDSAEAHYQLAGVVSMGKHSCGMEGVPEIYTNVFHYRQWIFDALEELD